MQIKVDEKVNSSKIIKKREKINIKNYYVFFDEVTLFYYFLPI